MKPACADIRRARPLLGTFVDIAAAGACRPALERAVETAFTAVAEVHRLMSFQEPDSDLARLNRDAATRPVAVHPWTFEVLEVALDLNRRSAGIFDICSAAALRNMSGDAGLELLPGRRVRLRSPDIAIDLGGIAKGYAVDRAIGVLRDHDVSQGLVNAGGDLAAFGPEITVVPLRDPRDPRRIMGQVDITNEALASSGRQLDPFECSQTTDSAVVDPRTSRPARAAVGATVRARRCMVADALTKIVMIAGEAASPVLAAYEASALFISQDGDLRVSANWQDAVRLAA
jgi:thiamine biosynthesis lipoprotein